MDVERDARFHIPGCGGERKAGLFEGEERAEGRYLVVRPENYGVIDRG